MTPSPCHPATPSQEVSCWTARPAPSLVGLSLLVPLYRDDPSPLIAALARCQPGPDTELVVYDDGSADPALTTRLHAALSAYPGPARLLSASVNRGRSAARNRLIANAKGRHLLFLDADMIPDDARFLNRWQALITAEDPIAGFGGISVSQAPNTKDTALHKFLAARSHCHSAAWRARDPAQHTATSNLLVRADIMAKVPFDEGFKGWGWEDVEWALRARAHGAIVHIDNPATHAGLDPVPTLLRKFREGGPNYGRLLKKHPAAVRRFASYRLARLLRLCGGHLALRPLMGWVARDPAGVVPLPARHAAAKIYRTACYAEHLS